MGDDSNKAEIVKLDENGNSTLAKPTSDVSKVQSAIQLARERGANVLAPETYLESDENYEYAVKVLNFDGTTQRCDNDDFYQPGGGRGWAPHKNALNRIASAFGLQWVDIERVDDMKDPRFAAYKAKAVAPDPATGQMQTYVDQYALDLRENSPRTKELRDNDNEGMLQSKRTHIAALAATGAKLRVIREATGIRMDYTDQEIQRPFAIVSVVSRPDETDQLEQAQEAHQAADELYDAETFEAEAANEAIDEAGGGETPEYTTDRADYPDPVDWKAMPKDEQTSWLEQAVELAEAKEDYDLHDKLAGTKHSHADIADLPFNWKERLYQALYEDYLDVGGDEDREVEPPPF